jgi:hypothetical protein
MYRDCETSRSFPCSRSSTAGQNLIVEYVSAPTKRETERERFLSRREDLPAEASVRCEKSAARHLVARLDLSRFPRSSARSSGSSEFLGYIIGSFCGALAHLAARRV